MGWLLIGLGIVVLLVTAWDYFNGESDTMLILDWDWIWFDFSRQDHPAVFHAIIVAQMVIGLGVICTGIANLVD